MTIDAQTTDISRPPRMLLALEWLMRRALDPSKRGDYVVCSLMAAWPAVLAAIVGVHRSIGDYAGYWTRPNWMVHIIGLPVALFLFRWATGKIARVSEPWVPANLPGVVDLVTDERGREKTYDALRHALTSGWNLAFVLGLMAAFHAFDMWGGVVEYYVAGVDASVPLEKDWTIMFLLAEANVGALSNLLVVLFAYAVQFTLLTVLVLFVVMMLRHNLFFLGRVYQRRRVPREHESAYIVIDLKDPDRCFGFRRANEAFNIQVWCLILAGLGLLTSRFANVTDGHARGFYEFFRNLIGADTSGQTGIAGLFPDVGQWVIAGAWLGALMIISIPAAVKILPLGNAAAHRNITSYLREFLPDSYWPYDDHPSNKEVDALAGRFAANAFWPTGNNRATMLFFGSFLVFLILVIPLKPLDGFKLDFVIWGVVMAGLAVGGTTVAFKALELSLTYVDPRLVHGSRELDDFRTAGDTGVPLEDRYDGRVFISYLREDASAYAGRLRDNLGDLCYPDRILADIANAEGPSTSHTGAEAIADADVVIVVMGHGWHDTILARYRAGPDPVTLALEAALTRQDVHVVPVLVGKAEMPRGDDLPEVLQPVARRNAIEISDTRWDYDVRRLLQTMKNLARSHRASLQAVALGSRYDGHIFINYRRGGATPYAGRLRDTLKDFCHPERIFRDLETIPGGHDFAEAIDQALVRADVVIVIIGSEWLTVTDDEGNVRLHQPNDWVSLEVAAALARKDVYVVPVLVGDARMPDVGDLPAPLRPLAHRTPVVLHDDDWDASVGQLVLTLKSSAGPGDPAR